MTQKKDYLTLQFQKVPVIVRLAPMFAACGEEAQHENHSPQKVEKEKSKSHSPLWYGAQSSKYSHKALFLHLLIASFFNTWVLGTFKILLGTYVQKGASCPGKWIYFFILQTHCLMISKKVLP